MIILGGIIGIVVGLLLGVVEAKLMFKYFDKKDRNFTKKRGEKIGR